MTKREVVNFMVENKARMNEETKHYEVSEKQFNNVVENLPEDLKIVKSKTKERMFSIASKDGKTRFVIIDVIVKEKAKKENNNVGTHGHKAKGTGYIVLLKKKDEKKEEKITDMTTCSEIKAFLKTVSKKQLEYLKIYDCNKNEVRKSAWVG